MPRRNRCVLPGLPCHVTQRGVDRREVFSSDQDRITYLRLVQENLSDARVRILGYCLMTNHVHCMLGRSHLIWEIPHAATLIHIAHTRPFC